MTLQQLEYVLAVARHRHFARAAEACFVTQPTLSMMIQKLEEELGVKIFDRSRKPVSTTPVGELILERARKALKEAEGITELVKAYKGHIEGTINMGIIPTLAPYILPLFARPFLEKYPGVKLRIWEYTTQQIIQHLREGSLDVGLMATPVNYPGIDEHPVFYEPFVVYTTNTYQKEYLVPKDIDPNQLWLLEEAHCFQSQVVNLCDLRQKAGQRLDYEAGSIETLIQLVDSQQGITILPQLATISMAKKQRQRLKPFQPPAPAREISLVAYHGFARDRLLVAIKEAIVQALPSVIKKGGELERVDIDIQLE
ncbi:MAG: LysR family transcriptional regulator [Phaeodactylibacter sp.]|nr:LysR family transcriptional regulator [Phaeodactylibacter sp.]MCB9053547.1 LysR family transcriptional regulator [Lewinellaceae bacterium]